MEYFRIVEVSSTEEKIHQKLSLAILELFCESIFALERGEEICPIGGMWGDFTLRRDQIMWEESGFLCWIVPMPWPGTAA